MRKLALLISFSFLISCDSNSNQSDDLQVTWLEQGTTIRIQETPNTIYRFSLEKPGVAIFKFSGTSSLEFTTTVSHSWYIDGRALSSSTIQDQELIVEYLLLDGSFTLWFDNDAFQGRPIDFDLSFDVDFSDTLEFNNSLLSSKEIEVGEKIDAQIRPYGDLDYFKFMKTEDQLDLTITHKGNLKYEILDARNILLKSEILQSDNGLEKTVQIPLSDLEGGRNFIRFTNKELQNSVENDYSFTLE